MLTDEDARKQKLCKYDLMPIKIRGECLYEGDPSITDCLDCMVESLYLCLVDNKVAEAMNCLHVLANIHEDVKGLLELLPKKVKKEKGLLKEMGDEKCHINAQGNAHDT